MIQWSTNTITVSQSSSRKTLTRSPHILHCSCIKKPHLVHNFPRFLWSSPSSQLCKIFCCYLHLRMSPLLFLKYIEQPKSHPWLLSENWDALMSSYLVPSSHICHRPEISFSLCSLFLIRSFKHLLLKTYHKMHNRTNQLWLTEIYLI